MPVNSSVAPEKGYVKAGRFGKDMKPDMRTRSAKKSGKLGSGHDPALIKSYPAPSGTDLSKKGVFLHDSDMGLIKHSGKKGKY